MKRYSFLFPGQGAQAVGMYAGLLRENEIVRRTFEEAEDVLHLPVRALCTEGPSEELNATVHTQPCIFTAEIAAFRLLAQEGIEPSVLFGFSLGECSAAVAGGCMPFGDGLLFISQRAKAMQKAVPPGQGGMLAVIGQSEDGVRSLCDAAGDGLWMANYNCPKQIVCSGTSDAVSRAVEIAERESIVVKRLDVSVPSHCPLMQSAADALASFLQNITFADSRYPILRSSDGELIMRAADVKKQLIYQLTSPVRCELCLSKLSGLGISDAVEVGPGRVLTGFLRKIDGNVARHILQTTEDLRALLESDSAHE